MSLFSGRAKTWLGAPLHSGVLFYTSQSERPRPTKRSAHTAADTAPARGETWILWEEKDETGAEENRKQKVEEERGWRRG